ncbi:DUF3102 domain-containing protein [Pseudoflavonifractor phocaeensis]|uniref:DUF3102 domain-containing protein n=1 Tax=Pseudoflavonifractor phocaeensis TaxID=1870988 RepID=UPI0030B9044F
METITLEIQTLQTMHTKAMQITLGLSIEIGRRLVELKAKVRHGEWGAYINQNFSYSRSTANNLMRTFEEYGAPQQSMFGPEANSQALGNLSYTKAVQLLAIPAEEREAFVEENHVEDMSTRELDKAIRERNEARAAAEHAAADQRAAEQARDKMAEDMKFLNISLAGTQEEREKALQRVARLEAELDKAKEAESKAKDKQKQAEAAVEELKRSMEEQEKVAKKAAMSGDVEMAQFDAFYGQVKEMGNKMNDLLIKARSREDKTVAHVMEKALRYLAEVFGRCAE